MKNDAIRRTFLDYFVERDHLELAGLPLVPNDPSITTLFTIAGMQQMIPYFLGREKPASNNMVTVQKTIRTNDIDEVGDLSHCTFFEMLGNFSVGAYFKREAIAYTWDFLVNTMRIPAERWWAVTYPGDDEARESWIAVGMPAERIGETEDNFWGPPGPYGPCGPNSEIHFDRGIEFSCGSPNCRPETECCDRFVEIWNDVFMSMYQEESGERRDLPWKNVDTGMGFERLVMVVQGAESIYDTDLYQTILSAIPAAGTYGQDAKIDRSMRIIADHSRAITFIISDGVMPASDGRGYVLRRLLRRAALHGRLLGIERPFLSDPIEAVMSAMEVFYIDLTDRREHILNVVQQEEERFLQTLGRGLGIFEDLAERALRDGQSIAGNDAFVLYDTHGFPLEMTVELAQERGLQVDREGFGRALKEQQVRARQSTVRGVIGTTPETFVDLAKTLSPTVFTGYDELRTTTEVVAILAGGEPVPQALRGDCVEIVLARTPFYAESGGQVGDTGTVRGDTSILRVTDTTRPYSSFVVHVAEVETGQIAVGDVVEAEVDAERRLHILPHHSGTHLVHKALQEVLGREATQAGSLVAPDRLRFDFTWPRALTDEELRDVQDRVNAAIWANLPVRINVMSYDEALRTGAMALFGEKYGERVRVVSMGDWSKELCGGTHVGATGDIGLLVITSETGIGSGVRRLEALAGAAAYAYVNDLREQVLAAAAALDTRPEALVSRAQAVVTQARDQEKRLDALTRKLADREAEALVGHIQKEWPVDVVVAQIFADSRDYLRAVSDAVKSRLENGIVILAAVIDDKPALTMAVSRSLTEEGYRANDILRQAAKEAGGNAGGSLEFAQGAVPDASKLAAVFQRSLDVIRRKAEE